MKNLLTILLLFLVHFVNGQSGSIQGTVTEEDNKPVMFANITLEKNDVMVFQTQTDIDGNYAFHHLESGTYNVIISYVGFAAKRFVNVMILDNQKVELNTNLYHDCYPIDIPYTQPKNNPWDLIQGATFSNDDIQRSPHKN